MSNNWKPGDFVLITGHVYSSSGPEGWAGANEIVPAGYVVLTDLNRLGYNNYRIFRTLTRVTYDVPMRAMILGWSTRQIGRVHHTSCLEVDQTFKVWCVMPLDARSPARFRKIRAVFFDQIKGEV